MLFNRFTLLSYLPGDPGQEIYEFVMGGHGGGGGGEVPLGYHTSPL